MDRATARLWMLNRQKTLAQAFASELIAANHNKNTTPTLHHSTTPTLHYSNTALLYSPDDFSATNIHDLFLHRIVHPNRMHISGSEIP